MESLLPYAITVLAIWVVARLWQVRRLSVRYERVLRTNIEQDRPVKG